MNSSSDPDEPLGEAPEVNVVTVIRAMDAQTKALREIRAILDRLEV